MITNGNCKQRSAGAMKIIVLRFQTNLTSKLAIYGYGVCLEILLEINNDVAIAPRKIVVYNNSGLVILTVIVHCIINLKH